MPSSFWQNRLRSANFSRLLQTYPMLRQTGKTSCRAINTLMRVGAPVLRVGASD